VISRLTNFRFSASAPDEELQFVQHTLPGVGGYSGSPMYLPNGRVVAVHNSFRAAEDRGAKTIIAHAIRIDCLWELLVHHKLDDKVPVPVERSRLNVKRWLKPDEAEVKFRRAVKLADEAAYLIDYKQEYMAGVRKCNEAIKLAPAYPYAYWVRCAGRNGYYSSRPLTPARARSILAAAARDADTYARLMSSDPRALTGVVNTAINVAAVMKNGSLLRRSLPNLNKALGSASLGRAERAELLSLRGACQHSLGNKARAREDFDESIELDPDNDVLYDNRARYWEAIGNRRRAAQDRAKARAIRKALLEKGKDAD
jgi:hypothetical protein